MTISSRKGDVVVDAAISSLNRPAFCAASALFCERTANRSHGPQAGRSRRGSSRFFFAPCGATR